MNNANQHLSNLLARIHGDGGHYEAEHGTERAAIDADFLVVAQNVMLDELEMLKAEIAGWKRDQAENLQNQCKLVDQITALTAERDALKDAARLSLDALNTCETEGEQVRYSTYDTESVGSAIAALKAVL